MSQLYNIFFKLNLPEEENRLKRFFKLHKSAIQQSAATQQNSFVLPPQYFSGNQLINLYNVPSIMPVTVNTKQTKIAIIVAFTYPGLINDLSTYWKNDINFGPNSTPPKVNVRTMPGATVNEGWAQEECLDVQMVCTINPNANIWVVEAKSDTIVDLMAAVDYAVNTLQVDVISMSWGDTENSTYSTYNNRFNNVFVSYCAASGDANTASWPSTLSNCMSIGGTTLLWTPNASRLRKEYSWNLAGCGYSSTVSQPNYQKNISNISHTHRAIPDVSLVANDQTCVYTVYAGQWYGVGGTSVATPIFAAMISLANQMRFNINKPALTTVYSTLASPPANYVAPSNNIQSYLYTTVYNNKTEYQNVFYDVVLGTDKGSIAGTTRGLTTYSAGSGYDLTTGLGSPNCTNLCKGLVKI
jgi:subtilase family serine protease